MKICLTNATKTSRSVLLLSSCAVCALTPIRAIAQDAAELPPVIVEGATVDKPKVKIKTRQTNASAQAVPGPAPSEASATAAGPAEAVTNAEGSKTVTGVPADQIGRAVTVVTGEQLRAQQIRHAGEALRSIPGVAVSTSGGQASFTQVRMRGAEANQTLVLIDGIDAADTSNGEFDFAHLLAEDIERIEVIRGGQSGIGGSKAIGGVINIITRDGKGPLTFSARAEGGSFNTRDVVGRASVGNEKFWIAVSGNVRESDGINISTLGDENDPWKLGSFNVKGGAEILRNVTLDYSLRNMKKTLDTDTGFGLITPIFFGATQSDTFSESDIWMGGARLTWDSFDGAFTQVLKTDRNSTATSSYNRATKAFSSVNDNEAEKLGYLATYRFGPTTFRNSVTGMVQQEDETFTPSTNLGGLERERGRMAYVGEYRAEILDRLYPNFSVRKDDNDTFQDFTTWNAAASLKLPELSMRPHASVGTAVTLPGMFEQFGFVTNVFQGNPDLTPEESFGWDLGAEFSFFAGRAIVDVTYFNTDLTNEISTVGFLPGTYRVFNAVGESTREGIEVSSRFKLTNELSFGASYTHLEAFEPNPAGGKRVEVRRPEHAGRLDANYSFSKGRGNLNVAAIYNGEMQDTVSAIVAPTTRRIVLDDYWLVNVAGSYRLTPQWEVYGRVENLFNEDYQDVFGFNTPGVAAYAGVKFTFEELQTKAWSEGR